MNRLEQFLALSAAVPLVIVNAEGTTTTKMVPTRCTHLVALYPEFVVRGQQLANAYEEVLENEAKWTK